MEHLIIMIQQYNSLSNEKDNIVNQKWGVGEGYGRYGNGYGDGLTYRFSYDDGIGNGDGAGPGNMFGDGIGDGDGERDGNGGSGISSHQLFNEGDRWNR